MEHRGVGQAVQLPVRSESRYELRVRARVPPPRVLVHQAQRHQRRRPGDRHHSGGHTDLPDSKNRTVTEGRHVTCRPGPPTAPCPTGWSWSPALSSTATPAATTSSSWHTYKAREQPRPAARVRSSPQGSPFLDGYAGPPDLDAPAGSGDDKAVSGRASIGYGLLLGALILVLQSLLRPGQGTLRQ
jgi:hypothetical protein